MQPTINIINEILTSFHIKAECVKTHVNRHFAFYDLVLEPGCRINKISCYAAELSLAMKTMSPFIVKPIPHEGIVRLQTTHTRPETLKFSDLSGKYTSNAFMLGESDEGNLVTLDNQKDPNVLIAGCTGSGKSTLLHTLIHNMLMKPNASINLIDTKMVEFNAYNRADLNRVSCAFDYQHAMLLLDRIYETMNDRYRLMNEYGVTNVSELGINFPSIYVVIDEVCDLMLNDEGKQFESLIVKLAQKSRASGIYLILATQRPSVNVLTGLIKANFPARIACKVSSKIDSRIILDFQGAENLVGRGDAIIHNSENHYTRFQVAYLDKNDIASQLSEN